MDAKRLYLLQAQHNGISNELFRSLSKGEQSALAQGKDGKYRLLPSHRAKFSVVLTGGVFDILHIGHILTLTEAKKHGDLLIVVVATDSRVEQIKKRKPIHDADYRRAMVASLKPVDLAIVGGADMMETFARVSPDAVAFGYDQSPMPLPQGCRSVHLKEVVSDPKMAKTSRIIRELGL